MFRFSYGLLITTDSNCSSLIRGNKSGVLDPDLVSPIIKNVVNLEHKFPQNILLFLNPYFIWHAFPYCLPVEKNHGAVVTIGVVLILGVSLAQDHVLQHLSLLSPVIRGHHVTSEFHGVYSHSGPKRKKTHILLDNNNTSDLINRNS